MSLPEPHTDLGWLPFLATRPEPEDCRRHSGTSHTSLSDVCSLPVSEQAL